MKKHRSPRAKPGELAAKFGKSDDGLDLYYCHGGDGATSADSKLLALVFESTDIGNGKNLRQELADRGYDITTLKFSVMQTVKPSSEIYIDESNRLEIKE